MCRAVECKKCHKTTWAGCGEHVEQVMGPVPRAERCSCAAQEPQATPQTSKSAGLFSRLFGR